MSSRVHIPSPFISNGLDLVACHCQVYASEQLTLAVNCKSEESRCSKTANKRLEVGNGSVRARNKDFLLPSLWEVTDSNVHFSPC